MLKLSYGKNDGPRYQSNSYTQPPICCKVMFFFTINQKFYRNNCLPIKNDVYPANDRLSTKE